MILDIEIKCECGIMLESTVVKPIGSVSDILLVIEKCPDCCEQEYNEGYDNGFNEGYDNGHKESSE